LYRLENREFFQNSGLQFDAGRIRSNILLGSRHKRTKGFNMTTAIAILVAIIGAFAYKAFAPESKPQFSTYQQRLRAKVGYSADYSPNNY